jgi:hypothetical protein
MSGDETPRVGRERLRTALPSATGRDEVKRSHGSTDLETGEQRLVTDGGSVPRTDEPTDGFGQDFSRFLSPRDGADHCPQCGSDRTDVWAREGATSGVAICVDCPDAVVVDTMTASEGFSGDIFGVSRGDRL